MAGKQRINRGRAFSERLTQTHQPITVTMTATLSYTLLLAIVYLGRKAFSLKTHQQASA